MLTLNDVKTGVVTVGKVTGKVIGYAALGALAIAASRCEKSEERYECNDTFKPENENDRDDMIHEYLFGLGYGDAVAAISKSDMSSYYKNEAIGYVKHGMTNDYYRGVIAITRSSMSSYYKAEAIKKM